MVYFLIKNPYFGQILKGLAMEDIIWPFCIFLFIWYIFPILVCCTKKYMATLGPITNASHNFLQGFTATSHDLCTSLLQSQRSS
jgi:uncharacterized membrane protein (DUF485 family)